MSTFLRKNFALLLAFALPIVLIAGIAISTYLPALFLSTSYNFVYSSCTDRTDYYPYRCEDYLRQRYTVVNNVLVSHTVDMSQDADKNGVPDFQERYTDRIFLHDTRSNESREISLEEARKLTLNNLLTSPDGVTVSSHYNRSGGDFFFVFGGGGSSYGQYLTKGSSRKKLNLINSSDQYYYQNNFQFLGWVMPGRTE